MKRSNLAAVKHFSALRVDFAGIINSRGSYQLSNNRPFNTVNNKRTILKNDRQITQKNLLRIFASGLLINNLGLEFKREIIGHAFFNGFLWVIFGFTKAIVAKC